MDVTEIQTPAFLVDYDIMKKNCKNMLDRCSQLGVTLRPHMKTHKTLEGGVLMTGGTKRCIVVSTIAEAEFYAEGGFDDILYAHPLGWDKVERCRDLTVRLEKFSVMVDNISTVGRIAKCQLPVGKKWHVFVAVNSGNEREGIPWNADYMLREMVSEILANNLTFEGMYTHCGQSYHSKGRKQLENVVDDVTDKMVHVKNVLQTAGLPCPLISLGSTPSCSHLTEKTKCLTEIHPGNYAFYDGQQNMLGSCQSSEIACRVATRVIGHYPHGNHMLIDCGFAALSRDGYDSGLETGFAQIIDNPRLRLDRMTQELGVVTSTDGQPLDFDRYPIGTLLYLTPYHSCATAMMYPYYHITENNEIVGKSYPNRGWLHFPDGIKGRL